MQNKTFLLIILLAIWMAHGIIINPVKINRNFTTGLTEGIVAEILTGSPTHPRGIKVRLQSGEVGRVQVIGE